MRSVLLLCTLVVLACIPGTYLQPEVPSLCYLYCPSGYSTNDATQTCDGTPGIIFDFVLDRISQTVTDQTGVWQGHNGATSTYYPPSFEVSDPVPSKRRGYHFDGNQFLTVNNGGANPTLSASFSVLVWANLADCAGTSAAVGKSVRARQSFDGLLDVLLVKFSGCTVTATLNGVNSVTGSGVMAINTWHAVAVTASAGASDTEVKIYFDSALDISTTMAGYLLDYSDGQTGIGVNFDFGPVAADLWKGYIWEVKLYNYAIPMVEYLAHIQGAGWPSTAASALSTCSFLQYDDGTCQNCNVGCSNGCVSTLSCYLCDDPLCMYCTRFEVGYCTTCVSNASPVTGVCECALGYCSSAGTCVSCHSTCSACSDSSINGCTACKANAQLTAAAPSACSCSGGFYPNPDAATCSACDNSCLTCSNAGISGCLSCKAHASLAGSAPNSCACDSGFYPNLTPSLCQACDNTCLACSTSGSSGCQSCKANAHLVAISPSSCACDVGFYPNPDASLCSPCDNTCYTCSSTGENGCLTCKSNAHLASAAPSNCICDSAFFPNLDAAACTSCDTTCLACSTGGTNGCETCRSNAHLSGPFSPSSCSCDNGFFPDPDAAACSVCDITCLTCSSVSGCLSCKANASLLAAAPSICICNGGFAPNPDSATCSACDNTCLACSNTSINGCSACKTNASLYSSAPSYCTCNVGYFPNLDASACSACHITCLTCTNSSINDCGTCKNNAHLAGPAPSNCACDSGFEPRPDASFCSVCHPTCHTCSDTTVSGCLSCNANAHLEGAAPSSCYCNQGFYRNNYDLSICTPCHHTCASCDLGNYQDCTSCRPHAHLFSMPIDHCECDSGYYPWPDSSNCQPCAPTCRDCTDGFSCLSCRVPAAISPDGFCECPAGFALSTDSRRCVQCDFRCLSCTETDSCSKCRSHAHLQDGLCQCDRGYWALSRISTLSYCVKECSGCAETIYFLMPTTDIEAYQVSENCVPQAKSFEAGPAKCVLCPEGCVSCISDSVCLQCDIDWFLHSNNHCSRECEVPNKNNCENGSIGDKCFSATMKGSEHGVELVFSANLSGPLSASQLSVQFHTPGGVETQVNWTLIESSSHWDYLIAFNSSDSLAIALSFLNQSNINSVTCLGLSTPALSSQVNFTSNIQEPAETATPIVDVSVAGTVLITLAVSILMSRGSQLLWTMLLDLQFESYLPMSVIDMPSSLRTVLISSNPINFLFNPLTYFRGRGEGEAVDLHLQRGGVDSYLFFENVMDLTAPFAILVVTLLYYALFRGIRCLHTIGKASKKLKQDLPLLLIESHLTICMAVTIQFYDFCYGQWHTSALHLAACVCAVFSACVLAFISVFSYATFIRRLGYEPNNGEHSLFVEFTPLLSFSSRSYYVLFCTRRLIFCITQVFLWQYPMLQGILNVGHCLWVKATQFAVYLKLYIHYEKRLLKGMHIAAELFTAIVTALCQLFLLGLNTAQEEGVKYAIVAVLCLKAAVLLLNQIEEFVESLKSFVQKKYAKVAIDQLPSTHDEYPNTL